MSKVATALATCKSPVTSGGKFASMQNQRDEIIQRYYAILL